MSLSVLDGADQNALLGRLKALSPSPLPPELWAELAFAYAQPKRAYHNLNHVLELAEHWAHMQEQGLFRRPCEAFLAILFHDAIYRPGRKDNEALSADLAVQALAPLASAHAWDLAWVAQTIRLTARHGQLGPADVDGDQALVLDADMAILAAPWPRFLAYDAAIRQEFGHVPGLLYRMGRRAFLKGLLKAPSLYLSPWGQRHWAEGARSNVARALTGGAAESLP